MEININVNTSKPCIDKRKDEIVDNCRTKIVKLTNFSINESSIAYIISSKIPYYSNFFSILEDYEMLNVSQLNDTDIELIKDTDPNQYFLFKYFDKHSIDFIDYLYSSTNVKKLVFDTINSFSHLLYGLHLLNEKGVCFFEISPKNIIYLKNFREKPLLSNFKFSIRINKLHYNYISHILNELDNFTYQPIEIHILYHFIKHKLVYINYQFCEEFCEEFVNNLSILRLFSDNYKKSYKKACVEFMERYINKPRKEVIDDILERNDKWDVYGISMLYIQLFGCISKVFSQKGNFLSKITIELSKNLHPDSNKRRNLEETLNIFNDMLNQQKEWKFINNLNNNLLNKLFDEFSK